MLRRISASRITEYSQARTKLEKSIIINGVVKYIRTLGGFVKLEQASGCWIHAEDLLCREKVSGNFRDALNDYHKSNNNQLSAVRRPSLPVFSPTSKRPEKQRSAPATHFTGLDLLDFNEVVSQKPAFDDDEESLSGLSLSLSLLPENERSSMDFFDMSVFDME